MDKRATETWGLRLLLIQTLPPVNHFISLASDGIRASNHQAATVDGTRNKHEGSPRAILFAQAVGGGGRRLS